MTELEQRKQSFEELRRLVTQRHRHNDVAYRQNNAPPVDEPALRLGRYLRAARKNARLSPQALAERAGLSPATILALEQGLILSQNIEPVWLRKIAGALHEDVNSFRLLLGQPPLPPRRKRLPLTGPLWPQSQMRPVVASLSAALLCLVLSAIVWLHPPRSLYVPLTATSVGPEMAKKTTLVDIQPEERLNMANAEKGLKRHIALQLATAMPTETAPGPDIEAAALRELLRAARVPETPTLVDISAEERLNLIKAEFRFENQVRILQTLIDIDAEDRQNMIKAETRL